MTSIAILGYSSIDFPAVIDGYFNGDQTVLIKHRPKDAFPRPGGCPLYVAGPIAEQGFDSSIISWVGNDELGRLMIKSARDRGINVDTIAIDRDGSTPMCFLIYQEDGSCGCCFDPGMLGREQLDEQQAGTIASSDFVCFTVGPPNVGMAALPHVRKDAIVAWVVKCDPKSFTDELRWALAARADYIFCNRSERRWVDEALAKRTGEAPVIFQTNGGGQVEIHSPGGVHVVDVDSLKVHDTTGAGDTFAGGCITALARKSPDMEQVALAGIAAARDLLGNR